MALSDYIKLVRFNYHITFIATVLGALLFAPEITPSLLPSLLVLYLSFNVLLYGGIYTTNDIADSAYDSKHPLKRNRPLPSGRVGIIKAVLFATTLIAAGLISGFTLFGRTIFLIYLAVLALNFFYTLVAKRVPYLELLVNSATHPLRFLMGTNLAGAGVPFLLLFAIFLLAFGLACVRRVVEKDVKGWEVRKTLKSYQGSSLLFLQLVALAGLVFVSLIDNSVPELYYTFIIITYLVLVMGTYASKQIRGFFRSIWTK